MSDELYEDMKRIADLVDEVQAKYDGTYIHAVHCKDSIDILASVTIEIDGEYKDYVKWAKYYV